MDTNARRPFKWSYPPTPLSVLLTMTLGPATLRVSPINDERQPEPSDPILLLAVQTRFHDSIHTDAQDSSSCVGVHYVNSTALPTSRNGDGFGPHGVVQK